MSNIIDNPIWLKTLCRHRQANELALAKSIYQVFNQGLALKNIQIVSTRVMTEIVENWDAIAIKVWGECSNLDIFKRFPSKKPEDIIKGANSLTASDCADVFYICGEWILAGGGTKKGYLPAKEILMSYKGGVTSSSQKKSDSSGYAMIQAEQARHNTWKEEEGGRFRGKWEGGIERHIKMGLGPASVNGINLKRSKDGSTVLKVDRMFGLLRGADISGSTAEAASILERWGSDLLHAAYYLLPLATLVYNGHHTLYEVALTMSINKLCDYHIGFYTTLLPSGTPPELRSIESALREAEIEAFQFVVYYENQQPAGGLEFTQAWERKMLKNSLFTSATEVLAKAQTMTSFPSRIEVSSLINQLAPNLNIGIPELFKSGKGSFVY